MLLSIISWVLYAQQTNFRYPFMEATNTWKWFYRDALPNEKTFVTPWHGFQSQQSISTGREAFRSQWEEFKSKQVDGLTDLRTDTRQDLEQVYVLHVNERYKNLFLTQLRSLIAYGLIICVILSTVAFLVGLYLGRPDTINPRTAP